MAEYSSHPHRYRICQADEHLRNFHDPVDIKGCYGSAARLFHAYHKGRIQTTDEIKFSIKMNIQHAQLISANDRLR